MDNQIILKTKRYVRSTLEGEGSGHDWWHIVRVWNNAKHIAQTETADMLIVELAALLHDIADYKLHGGDINIGPKTAHIWLEKCNVDEDKIAHICKIIKNLSFKGAKVKSEIDTIEGMIVQDADRLDAIGAIGIARCFAYGGFMKRELYNPEIKPEFHDSFEKYKNNQSSSINHFYEKLLLLKDLMNTQTAKKIAEQRHKFMENYLNTFFEEWEGKK